MAATQWVPEDEGPGGADTTRPWRTAGEGPVSQRRDAPVFAALVDQWRSAGRMVPGQADSEWAELVGRVPRLTGV